VRAWARGKGFIVAQSGEGGALPRSGGLNWKRQRAGNDFTVRKAEFHATNPDASRFFGA
jgi:hypothetical protein